MSTKNERRLLQATIRLLRLVESGAIDMVQVASCMEQSMDGLQTQLIRRKVLIGDSIAVLDFSESTRMVLETKSIKTIRKLVSNTGHQLLGIRALKVPMLREIRSKLSGGGFKLKGD
jgi:DNA-directed RNA polymerase alpha subunit